MSLVPIIYTSLLVVSVFLIIVITISYISFKARTKGQPAIKHSTENEMYVPVYQNLQPAQTAAANYPVYKEEQYVYPEEKRIQMNQAVEGAHRWIPPNLRLATKFTQR